MINLTKTNTLNEASVLRTSFFQTNDLLTKQDLLLLEIKLIYQ